MPSVPEALGRSHGAAELVGEASFDDMPELVDYSDDDEPAPVLISQPEVSPYGARGYTQWQTRACSLSYHRIAPALRICMLSWWRGLGHHRNKRMPRLMPCYSPCIKVHAYI